MVTAFWKKSWVKFLGGATWLTALISTVFVKPPLLSLEETTNYQLILRLIIASLIALTYILTRTYSRKKDYKRWLVVSVSTASAAILFGVFYLIEINEWSVNFYKDRLVIGTSISGDAIKKRDNIGKLLHHTNVDNETLVKAFAGKTSEIWPKNEIMEHYYLFGFVYVFEFVLIASFIISVGSAINCYESKKK